MLLENYHTHTVFCDGSNTPEEMVQQALYLGFEHLGFSGHMDADIHMDWNAYTKEIRRLQKKYAGQLDILMGVELDNLYNPACCPGAEYIIGSTHFPDVPCNRGYDGNRRTCEYSRSARPISVDASESDMKFLADEYFQGDFYALARSYFDISAKVYDRTHCTFVGHFDLVTRFNDSMHFLDESDPRYTGPAVEAMEYLVQEGVPFEINCGAVNRGRKKEFYPNTFLLKHLYDLGGEILISSDAHQKELLNGAFNAAAAKAIECGFTHTNILVHDEFGNVEWKQVPLA